MSVLTDIERLIQISEDHAPKLRKSRLWRRAAEKARESAAQADREAWRYNDGAREAPDDLEEHECQEDPAEQGESGPDLNEQLTSLLKRPPRSTSKTSTAKANVVKLTRSNQ